MENSIAFRLRKNLKSMQEIPGLVVKLQSEGLIEQIEKVCGYAYDTAETPDEQYKQNLKIIVDQLIDIIWESDKKN